MPPSTDARSETRPVSASRPPRRLRWLERLLGLPIRRMGGPAPALVILCGAVLLFAMIGSLHDVRRYPGEDVRSKVTSARAMLLGLNPYAYEVGPDTPEQLIDYTRPWAKMADMHKTPTMLLLYVPTSPWPWRVQRLLWWALEWTALIASIVLLVRCGGRPTHRLLFLCVATFGFANAYLWRLHVERGQDYVFLALLQALAVASALRHHDREVRPGLAMGIAIALRPTLVATTPVLWVMGRRRMAGAAVATGALVILATLPLVGIDRWLAFQRAVGLLEQVVLGNTELEASLGQPYRPARPVVEGYDYSQWTYLPSQSANLTLTNLGATIVSQVAPRSFVLGAWPAATRGLAMLTVAGFTGLMWLGRRRGLPPRAALALAILGGLSMDYTLGIVRSSYQDVLLLVPLALLLPILLDGRTPRSFGLLVLGGVIGGLSGWTSLGMVLRSVGVMGGLVACAIWLCLRPQSAPRHA